jgi:thymidylate synthase
MFVTIEGDTADEVWLQASEYFRQGRASTQSSRTGTTEELLHTALCLHNPRERWVVSRSPAINPAFALAEVVWILRGRQDSAFVNYFNKRLPEFAGNGPTYHGAYGHRLRTQFGIDQLKRAFEALRANPDSRQVVLQIWDARTDLPESDGSAVAKDIPCNVCSLLKVRRGRLDWTQIMRSNDVFRGLPFNLVQFTSLQEILAGWLGLEVGQYYHLSDSLHLYPDSKTNVLTSSKIEATPNSDSLRDACIDTEIASQSLERLIEQVIDKNTNSEALVEAFDSLGVSSAWRNIAAVLVSEGCPKRGRIDASRSLMDKCTNALFHLLVQRWNSRTRSQ